MMVFRWESLWASLSFIPIPRWPNTALCIIAVNNNSSIKTSNPSVHSQLLWFRTLWSILSLIVVTVLTDGALGLCCCTAGADGRRRLVFLKASADASEDSSLDMELLQKRWIRNRISMPNCSWGNPNIRKRKETHTRIGPYHTFSSRYTKAARAQLRYQKDRRTTWF